MVGGRLDCVAAIAAVGLALTLLERVDWEDDDCGFRMALTRLGAIGTALRAVEYPNPSLQHVVFKSPAVRGQ